MNKLKRDSDRNKTRIKVVKRPASNNTNYKALSFVREKPEFVLAFLTIIFSIISAALNYLGYLFKARYFGFWGYSINEVPKSSSFLLIFIVSVLLSLCQFIFLSTVSDCFDKADELFKYYFHVLHAKKELRCIRKEIRNDSEMLLHVKEIERKCRNNTKIIRKRTLSYLWLVAKAFFLYVVGFFLIMAPFVSLIILSYKIVLSICLGLPFLMGLFVIVGTFIFDYSFAHKLAIIEIENEVFFHKDASFFAVDNITLNKFRRMDIKEFFSDSNIKKSLSKVLKSFIIIVAVLSLSCIFLPWLIPSIKDYETTSLSGKDYVCINKTENYLYLNEAFIDGEKLYICKDSHRICEYNSIDYTYHLFKEVMILDYSEWTNFNQDTNSIN